MYEDKNDMNLVQKNRSLFIFSMILAIYLLQDGFFCPQFPYCDTHMIFRIFTFCSQSRVVHSANIWI